MDSGSHSEQEVKNPDIPNDEELVIDQPTKINKVCLTFQQRSQARRRHIDLTDDDSQNRPKKITQSVQPKRDPFESLGHQICERVKSQMELYQKLYRIKHQRNSIEDYNENFKQLVVKHLLYGLQQLREDKSTTLPNDIQGFDGIQGIQAGNTDQQLDMLAALAKRIQGSIDYYHGSNLRNYQNRCKMIHHNVKDFSNRELRENILKGRITPEGLSQASQADLDTEERKLANRQKMKFLLAEMEVDIKLPVVLPQQEESNPEALAVATQRETVLRKKYETEKSLLVNELESLVSRCIDGFYEKVQSDLPSDIACRLKSQLNLLFQS